MSHLNWRNHAIDKGIRPHAERGKTFALVLDDAQRDALVAALEAVFSSGQEAELRVDLADGWAVFFKRREGESRLLLAHPEEDLWIATLALEEALGRALLDELRALSDEGSIHVTELASRNGATVASVSNTELSLSLR